MSANLTRIRVVEHQELMSDRRYVGLVMDLSDGSHKYYKFFLPCETSQIMAGLRALADEIQKEYHKG